ncbi:PilN domain-containing protein [uncultured Desulfuromonas sp.]|uniref:PilN domain-containing protein n=1 Tax=uncultured Desulfuromonas sp. TaxID=181013 RepID=UPI002AAB661B|nr:PilN domain-containing protein [uncultured Desulfuromonas sp.]
MGLTINLASRKHLNQRLASLLFGTGLVVLSAVLVLQLWHGFHSFTLEQQYRREVVALKQQLRQSTPKPISAKKMKALQHRYHQALDLWQRDAFHWSALLTRVETLLPEGVRLSSLQPDYAKNTLQLTGEARGLEQLQALLDQLHQADFTHVFLNSQQVVTIADGQGGEHMALQFSLRLQGVF